MWKKSSDLIGKVLSPALRLWLRSQVEAAEGLEIAIQGQDRQILRGYIPRVSLNSSRAVYQGLHLGEVQLTGENIRINIGQVLKGKPLQLLEPIQLTGQVRLLQEDLQASVSSSLLSGAFSDLLELVLAESDAGNGSQPWQSSDISWEGVSLVEGGFALRGKLNDAGGQEKIVTIQANLELLDRNTLRLIPLEIEGLLHSDSSLREFQVDLGKDVTIEEFSLDGEQLVCCGRLMVYN